MYNFACRLSLNYCNQYSLILRKVFKIGSSAMFFNHQREMIVWVESESWDHPKTSSPCSCLCVVLRSVCAFIIGSCKWSHSHTPRHIRISSDWSTLRRARTTCVQTNENAALFPASNKRGRKAIFTTQNVFFPLTYIYSEERNLRAVLLFWFLPLYFIFLILPLISFISKVATIYSLYVVHFFLWFFKKYV